MSDIKTSTILSLKTKIALAVAIILWSSAFVGIRMGLKGYSPGSLALFRFLIASICMGLIYLKWSNKNKFSKKDLLLLFLFGAIGIGGYHVFLNYGEISIPSGIASFIVSQSPLISMFFAIAFLRESFSPGAMVGALISIIGVGLISIGESDHFKFDIGILFMLIATLLSGLYSVLQKPFLKKYHAIDVTVIIIWGCTLVLLVYLPSLLRDIKTASMSATIAVVYLGIFPAAIAYIAWSYALARMPASQCVSFLYFMPVIATVLGWLCLGEVPVVLSLFGGMIALLGVWIANRSFAKEG